ncbi:MAG: helix-turn-helix domain-containing protein [Gemmatimonadales bacterium]|nr:helix-turn-helix domain-containing protein [Gemmatimonadales bacterium]
MLHLNPLSAALAFGALNGAAVAALLLRTTHNHAANRLLAALLGVLVLRLVPYIIGYAGAYDAYPWLSFAPFDLPLAIGPLLWLHVIRLTRGTLPPRWWAHLLPAAAHFTTYFTLFAFVPLETRHELVRTLIDPVVAPAITAATLAGLATYGWHALAAHRAYQQWLDDHLSNREEFRLPWLRTLLRVMAALTALWIAVALTDRFIRPLSYFDEFPFYLAQATIVWLLGLAAWRDAELRYPSRADEPDAEQPIAAGEPPPSPEPQAPDRPRGPDWPALGATYLAALRQHEWWRDPQLTLARLARHLATNESYVSKALNQGLGQGFNECINRLRVEAVAAAIRAGSTLDLVQIGFDSGFNSKASFQRAFVLYMNQTPSAYRDAVRAAATSQPAEPAR